MLVRSRGHFTCWTMLMHTRGQLLVPFLQRQCLRSIIVEVIISTPCVRADTVTGRCSPGCRDGRRRVGLAHPKNTGGRGDFVPAPSVLSRGVLRDSVCCQNICLCARPFEGGMLRPTWRTFGTGKRSIPPTPPLLPSPEFRQAMQWTSSHVVWRVTSF